MVRPRKLKIAVRSLALVPAFPFAILCGFGHFATVFSIFAQGFALVPGVIGEYFRSAFYALTLESFSILATTQIGVFFAARDAHVAEGVGIGPYCVIGRVRIGERTRFGAMAQVLSGQKQHTRDTQGRLVGTGTFSPVTIGADCWIGASAIIMADVGPRSTVGAGSVVGTPVPADTIVAGNPARALRVESRASYEPVA